MLPTLTLKKDLGALEEAHASDPRLELVIRSPLL